MNPCRSHTEKMNPTQRFSLRKTGTLTDARCVQSASVADNVAICQSTLETRVQPPQGWLNTRLTCAACGAVTRGSYPCQPNGGHGDFRSIGWIEPRNTKRSPRAGLAVKGWGQRGQPTGLIRGAASYWLNPVPCQAARIAKPRLSDHRARTEKMHTANWLYTAFTNARVLQNQALGYSCAPTSVITRILQ